MFTESFSCHMYYISSVGSAPFRFVLFRPSVTAVPAVPTVPSVLSVPAIPAVLIVPPVPFYPMFLTGRIIQIHRFSGFSWLRDHIGILRDTTAIRRTI